MHLGSIISWHNKLTDVHMALSFQNPDGAEQIWNAMKEIQDKMDIEDEENEDVHPNPHEGDRPGQSASGGRRDEPNRMANEHENDHLDTISDEGSLTNEDNSLLSIPTKENLQKIELELLVRHPLILSALIGGYSIRLPPTLQLNAARCPL